MFGLFLRVFTAVGLYGVVHSLLASRGAKQRAERWFGERQRSGLYRVFYIAQSFVSMAALLAYLARLPDRELYRVPGAWRGLLRVGQVGGFVLATAAAWQVGLARITGLRSLFAWLRGDAYIPPEPEAQGPAPAVIPRTGRPPAELRVRGPFRYSRHPLNLAPLPVFWLTPTMTVKRLAFNLAGTLYLVLGSLHEESRLRKAYAGVYRRYQHSGVPFYIPNP